ncbi:hypothetical protein [Actinomadura physcomitrii]|uniref:hypothetical protein n=1 Tax=Actinomadura physcomitrii TaxID=2650748 RepID=UPI00192448EC|nr:hypothetical protein [Actinomadura physcomitrii]
MSHPTNGPLDPRKKLGPPDTPPPQPASKHLRVLREFELIRVRRAGKQRLCCLDARGCGPSTTGVGGFERSKSESFDRLDEYVQDLKQRQQPHDDDDQ